MDELHPQFFTGLKVPDQPISDTDYVHGAANNPLGNLGARVIVPDGNWKPYMPFGQVQFKPGVYDTSDCTGFGYCDMVATQLNAMWKLGILTDKFISWARSKNYIQARNGVESFMFDPRVLGIMAGTTSAGNWLQTVADTARKRGLLPAGTLPGPESVNSADEYYNAVLITPEINALGQEFLNYIALPYQWIGTLSDADALKACPLYVALCTCQGWNTPPVPWCGITVTNHCVAEIATQDIFDSYDPFNKPLAADYQIPFKMMVLVTEQKGNKPVYKKCVRADGKTFGVLIQTPNGDQIIYATDPAQWISWSKPDSYGLSTVNQDGTPNFNTSECVQLPY